MNRIAGERNLKVRSELCFEVNLVDHCNLNCAFCTHFSPLAEDSVESYLDPDRFSRDCDRIAELTNGYVQYITFAGGEPLLHPNILEIIKIARGRFDIKTRIIILTNGILLAAQKDVFWQCCAENGIKIHVSKYPIKLNIDEILRQSKKYGVVCGRHIDDFGSEPESFLENSPKVNKREGMYLCPFDVTGSGDTNTNFRNCGNKNLILTLRDGRIYTCNIAAHAKLFATYFGVKLPLEDNNGIDIYKAKSKKEILEFLVQPVPLCRYCNIDGRTYGHRWRVSERKMTEWT
jgi:ABC-2 type transport system ATP-binding protein